jgi:hypothetical protein
MKNNYLKKLELKVEQIKDKRLKEELKKRIEKDKCILKQWDKIKNSDKLLKEMKKLSD